MSDTSRYPAYPDYRPSGVEWLGEIPSHWETVCFKRFIDNHVDKGNEQELPFVALEHIVSEEGSLVTGFEWEIKAANEQAIFHPGDVLFGKLRPYLRKYLLADRTGCCTTELLVLRPREGVCLSTFLFYLVQWDYFIAIANATSYGTKMPRTSWEDLGEATGLLPPLDEQRAIADFLDRETIRIDALIDAKRRLVALLEEKRAALISHAVTKGLDPGVPMKESGIAWLGEIPSHWETTQIRHISTSLQTGPFGSQLHSHEYVTDGTPVINPSHLQDGNIIPDWDVSVDEDTKGRLLRHVLKQGDIVFARRGELGRSALVTFHEEGWLCGTGSIRMRPRFDLVDPVFLNEFLSTLFVSEWLLLQSVGSTMDNLNTSILGRLPVPLPLLEEQIAIRDVLLQEKQRIHGLIEQTGKTITLLQEYRTALIAAAVTGKIDVRGYTGNDGSQQEVQ